MQRQDARGQLLCNPLIIFRCPSLFSLKNVSTGCQLPCKVSLDAQGHPTPSARYCFYSLLEAAYFLLLQLHLLSSTYTDHWRHSILHQVTTQPLFPAVSTWLPFYPLIFCSCESIPTYFLPLLTSCQQIPSSTLVSMLCHYSMLSRQTPITARKKKKTSFVTIRLLLL